MRQKQPTELLFTPPPVRKTYNFFGVPTEKDEEDLREKWNSRLKQLYGRGRWLAVKDEEAPERDFHALDELDSTHR